MEKKLKEAIERVSIVQYRDYFILSDLFIGYEWKKISISDRRLLGQKFLSKVRSGTIPNVEVSKKNPSKRQVYIKVKKLSE